jgi:hypothetical protein
MVVFQKNDRKSKDYPKLVIKGWPVGLPLFLRSLRALLLLSAVG